MSRKFKYSSSIEYLAALGDYIIAKEKPDKDGNLIDIKESSPQDIKELYKEYKEYKSSLKEKGVKE